LNVITRFKFFNFSHYYNAEKSSTGSLCGHQFILRFSFDVCAFSKLHYTRNMNLALVTTTHFLQNSNLALDANSLWE